MADLTKEQQKIVKEIDNKVDQKVEKEIDKQVKEEVKKRLSKEILEKTKKPLIKLRSEFKHQVGTAIIAAFGFLIAIAWKDLIVKFMEDVTPKSLLAAYPYIADLYSALIVTVFSVVGILLISNWVRNGDLKAE